MDILDEPLKEALIEFDIEGSWASNYREQGTTMGLNGGLLGLEITDGQMKKTDELAKEKGVSIRYKISSFQTKHPNTVRLTLKGHHGCSIQVLAASLGGGSIQIQKIDGHDVNISGGFFELLLFHTNDPTIASKIAKIIPVKGEILESIQENSRLTGFKFSQEIQAEELDKIKKFAASLRILYVRPVLPIVSGKETKLPFTTIDSLLTYAEKEKLSMGDMGLVYEKCQSGLSATALKSRMESIIAIIDTSISKAMEGTSFQDRILPQQSHLIQMAEAASKIPKNLLVNQIVSHVTAIMESKSAMEVIVANPTAGSCGTVGGVLKAVADDLAAPREAVIQAYFAAGLVGAYFAMGPGFSAEEHGCQVECGAASGMAAAGIVQLYGGTAHQAVAAASMAIQNMIGLICDPVADRVEVPCLGKNISAAMNALSSATMACSGFDAVIPLDEVIATVSKVSRDMPSCVKCTGKGGLALTKTALELKTKLEKRR